jgi:hypothetical protein
MKTWIYTCTLPYVFMANCLNSQVQGQLCFTITFTYAMKTYWGVELYSHCSWPRLYIRFSNILFIYAYAYQLLHPLDLPIKILYVFLFSPTRASYLSPLSLGLTILMTCLRIMQLRITLFFPGPSLLRLRFKYAPQHPVLCLRSSPQCKRPSFTPIQNSR